MEEEDEEDEEKEVEEDDEEDEEKEVEEVEEEDEEDEKEEVNDDQETTSYKHTTKLPINRPTRHPAFGRFFTKENTQYFLLATKSTSQ